MDKISTSIDYNRLDTGKQSRYSKPSDALLLLNGDHVRSADIAKSAVIDGRSAVNEFESASNLDLNVDNLYQQSSISNSDEIETGKSIADHLDARQLTLLYVDFVNGSASLWREVSLLSRVQKPEFSLRILSWNV
jgi:hypothetical protein